MGKTSQEIEKFCFWHDGNILLMKLSVKVLCVKKELPGAEVPI
jgi:hypothetical protein